MANIADKGGILQLSLSLWEDATQEMNLHESMKTIYSQKYLCTRTTYGRILVRRSSSFLLSTDLKLYPVPEDVTCNSVSMLLT